MPWYDFHCDNCGCDFEEFFGVDESRENLDCPECGSEKVERSFSRVSTSKFKRTTSDDDKGCWRGG
jgi:putative FmdB family regulatory protein